MSWVRNTPTGFPDEGPKRADNGVVGVPRASGAAGSPVDDEFLRPLGDIGVQVVHEHPKRGFLGPSPGRDGGSAGRSDIRAALGSVLWLVPWGRHAHLRRRQADDIHMPQRGLHGGMAKGRLPKVIECARRPGPDAPRVRWAIPPAPGPGSGTEEHGDDPRGHRRRRARAARRAVGPVVARGRRRARRRRRRRRRSDRDRGRSPARRRAARCEDAGRRRTPRGPRDPRPVPGDTGDRRTRTV
jgi:hypothetical protein